MQITGSISENLTNSDLESVAMYMSVTIVWDN